MRITRSAHGIVAGGASDGRGAWVCRRDGTEAIADERCLDTALAKHAFARAWRCEVTPDDEREIRAVVGLPADGDEPPDAH